MKLIRRLLGMPFFLLAEVLFIIGELLAGDSPP